MDKSKGSILLEALLSVVILSVSITLVIQSLTSSLRATKYGSQYTQASFMLDNHMIELLNQGVQKQEATSQEGFSFITEHSNPENIENPFIEYIQADIQWSLGSKEKRLIVVTYFPKQS